MNNKNKTRIYKGEFSGSNRNNSWIKRGILFRLVKTDYFLAVTVAFARVLVICFLQRLPMPNAGKYFLKTIIVYSKDQAIILVEKYKANIKRYV